MGTKWAKQTRRAVIAGVRVGTYGVKVSQGKYMEGEPELGLER